MKREICKIHHYMFIGLVSTLLLPSAFAANKRVQINEVHVIQNVNGTATALEILGDNLCRGKNLDVSIASLPNAFASFSCTNFGDQDLIEAALNVVLIDSTYAVIVDTRKNSGKKSKKSGKSSKNSAKFDRFEFTYGIIGEQGIAGEDGAKGITGDIGDTGPQGEQGNIGPQGVKGDTGSKGMQGDTGFTGAVGSTGEAGSTGPQGEQGPVGGTGPAGISGVAVNNQLWFFQQNEGLTIGATRTNLPNLVDKQFTLAAASKVKLTYAAQVVNPDYRVPSNYSAQHCAVWMLVDGVLVSNIGGYGSGFIQKANHIGGSWWDFGTIIDYIELPAGDHTITIQGNEGWGGSSGSCHFSSSYGGGRLLIESYPQ